MQMGRQSGFLLLEVLIAGLILTAAIASAMILFRAGFENLERVERVNLLSSKLLQAGSLLKITALERNTGSEDLGDGVTMRWTSHLLARPRAARYEPNRFGEGSIQLAQLHDLFLYRVNFTLECRGVTQDYQIHVFRSRPHSWR